MKIAFLYLTRFLVFFLTSTLNLQFTPGSALKKEKPIFVDLPKHCYSMKKRPCVIHLKKGKRLNIDHPKTLITLRKKSTLFISQKTFHLVEGLFFIQAKMDLSFKTPNANVKIGKGLAFFQVDKEKVTVMNVSSPELKLMHPGEKQPLFLPPGYQVWLGGFTSSSKNLHSLIGVPRAVHLNRLFSHWMDIHPENAEEFKKKAHQFQVNWKKSIQDISAWHKSIVKEKLQKQKDLSLTHSHD